MGRPLYGYGPSCTPGSCACSSCAFSDLAESSGEQPARPSRLASVLPSSHAGTSSSPPTLLSRLRASVLPNPSAAVTLPSLSTALQAEDGVIARHVSTERRILPSASSLQAIRAETADSNEATPFRPTSQSIDTSVSRVSMNSQRASRAAQGLPQSVSGYSPMLPARLGTPVPAVNELTQANEQASSSSALHPLDNWLALRNGRSERRSMRIGETPSAFRSIASTSTSSRSGIEDEGLARAQTAIENSRLALSQARLAIRNALLQSERLERVAAILRREVEGSNADQITAESAEQGVLDSGPVSFNLERSLAELRQASAEIDRVLSAANETAPRLTSRSLTSQLSAISRTSSGAAEAATGNTASTSRSQGILGFVERPREGIFHPTPLRPGASTSRNASAELPSWLSAIMQEAHDSSPLRDTDTATHNIDGSARAVTDHCLDETSVQTLRRRPRGAWRRLDANADEIIDDVDDDSLMYRVAGESPGRIASLGWTWTPAAASQNSSDQKGFAASATDSASRDRGRSGSEGISQRRFRFDGNREMVGR